MNYPNIQTPMTTNFDSYMDLRRFEEKAHNFEFDADNLERRRTRLKDTFEYIRKKFGRRRIINYN